MKLASGVFLRLFTLVAALAATLQVHAVTVGQLDDFQDGSSDNWRTGSIFINNIANGGPAGAGDRYIQYSSAGGFGTDSRMVILNDSQWLGTYSAGVTGIAMDLNNLGAQSLSIRLAFFVDSSDGYVSTTPFSLAAGSGWQHAKFNLNPTDFTVVGSPGDFNTLLSDFQGQLRILSSSSASLRGDAIAATLGVDNVQAIPEPGVLVLMALGGILLLILHPCVNNPTQRIVLSIKRVDPM